MIQILPRKGVSGLAGRSQSVRRCSQSFCDQSCDQWASAAPDDKQPVPLTCRNTGCHLSGWRDLNPRPLRPERSALPSCATPRWSPASLAEARRACRPALQPVSGRRPASAGWPRAGRRNAPARTATCPARRRRAASDRAARPRPVDREPLGLPPGQVAVGHQCPDAAARTAARRGCGRPGPGRSRRRSSGPAPGGTARGSRPATGRLPGRPARRPRRTGRARMCGSSVPTSSISRWSTLSRRARVVQVEPAGGGQAVAQVLATAARAVQPRPRRRGSR